MWLGKNHQLENYTTFGSTLNRRPVFQLSRWFVDGIDWINLLKDGWGALFGWLDRIGPSEEPIAGGNGGKGRKIFHGFLLRCWWILVDVAVGVEIFSFRNSLTQIWMFPEMVVPPKHPKHPKMIIFSRKTHGCWVPPF